MRHSRTRRISDFLIIMAVIASYIAASIAEQEPNTNAKHYDIFGSEQSLQESDSSNDIHPYLATDHQR